MMKKTVIVYASKHHGNTFKLIKAISDKYEIEIIDAMKETHVDLQEYDIVGFASGIDFGKFYLEIENFAREKLPFKKEVFFLYTCAMDREGFTDSIKEIALEKDAVILGEYGCRGYNTYGPWKLFGGMNKSHPTENEIQECVNFYEELLNRSFDIR